MTHAHFLQMGGFRITCTSEDNHNILDVDRASTTPELVKAVPRKPIIMKEYEYHFDKKNSLHEGVLTFSSFQDLLIAKRIRFPTITEDEISDRSKGDALSKGIALLQISWFIAQVLARGQQNLAISELELTTAALAGLNSIMYLCWWSKPLAVRFPVCLHTKEAEKKLQQVKGKEGRWNFEHSEFSLTRYLRHVCFSALLSILVFPQRMFVWATYNSMAFFYYVRGRISDQLRLRNTSNSGSERRLTTLRSNLTFILYTPKVLMLKGIPAMIYNLLLRILILPLITITGDGDASYFSIKRGSSYETLVSFSGFMINSQDKDDGFAHMSSMIFLGQSGTGAVALYLSSSLAGVLFGAIHCIAWDFQFPSHVEHTIWKASSVCVAGVCFFLIVGRFTLRGLVSLVKTHTKLGTGVLYYNPFMIIPAFVYILSRFTLFTVAFISLRHLPPSAFATVQWVDLVPHI